MNFRFSGNRGAGRVSEVPAAFLAARFGWVGKTTSGALIEQDRASLEGAEEFGYAVL